MQQSITTVSVEGVVNSTAYVCNVNYLNIPTTIRVLCTKGPDDAIPTNLEILKQAVASAGAFVEVSLEGCEMLFEAAIDPRENMDRTEVTV